MEAIKVSPVQLKGILKRAYKTVNSKRPVSVLIEGCTGIGKSQVVNQTANELKIGYIDFRASLMERPDVLGQPFQIDGKTKYALPDIFPTDPESTGILFFDEINRADSSTINALFQLLTDRQINGMPVGKNWLFVAATNPATSDYSTMELDSAFANRFARCKLAFNKENFISYAENNKWNVDLINYSAEKFDYKELGELEDKSLYISPRQLEGVNTMLTLNGYSHENNEEKFTDLSMITNTLFATQFLEWTNGERPVTLNELTKDTASALKRLEKHASQDHLRLDLIRCLTRELMPNLKGIDKDTIKSICMLIQADMASKLLSEYCFANKMSIISDFYDKEPLLQKRLSEIISQGVK